MRTISATQHQLSQCMPLRRRRSLVSGANKEWVVEGFIEHFTAGRKKETYKKKIKKKNRRCSSNMPSRMRLGRKSSTEQWRRTGTVNIILVSACATLLLGSLVTSIKKGAIRDINDATIIYESNCNQISRLNLSLHLLINLISSGILASSNFYMQILSSPSRKEIDRAHAHLRSLDIGIPSVKNIWSVSRFKRICWVILLLSSFPLQVSMNYVDMPPLLGKQIEVLIVPIVSGSDV
jgi:hypothetical protein